MIRIYGRRNSVNVQKVLWYCREQGLAFESVEVGGQFGQTREPWFTALNPNSLVPVIVDGPLVLWESNAILRYLDSRYGGSTQAQARAIADQWMDWASTVIMDRSLMPIVFVGLVRTPAADRDLQAIERGAAGLRRAFSILDSHLADRPFVAGETFSIGDIPVGILAYRWFSLAVERDPAPHLRRWMDRIEARAAFRSQVAGPLT